MSSANYVVRTDSCRLMAVSHTPAAHAVFEAIGIGQTHHTTLCKETGGDEITGNAPVSECLDTEIVVRTLFQVAQGDGRGLYRRLSRPCVIRGLSVLVGIARDVSFGSRPQERGFSVGQVAHREVRRFWESGIRYDGKVIYVYTHSSLNVFDGNKPGACREGLFVSCPWDVTGINRFAPLEGFRVAGRGGVTHIKDFLSKAVRAKILVVERHGQGGGTRETGGNEVLG